MKTRELKQHYRDNQPEIENRIKEFKGLKESGEERIFQELIFVILTSQTDAKKAWEAAQEVEEKGLLLDGSREQIKDILAKNEVQYEENKAKYILENREFLTQPTLTNPEKGLKLKEKIFDKNPEKVREWLVENIKGLSWKGASHFLRNIGYGKDFAIISGHIIRKMHQLELIEEAEQPKNKEQYLKYERKLQEFSEDIQIPLEELDLVLWSYETGEIFK